MNAEQYRAVIGWFNARPVAKMALRVVSRGAVALVYLGYLGMLAWLVWHRMGQFWPRSSYRRRRSWLGRWCARPLTARAPTQRWGSRRFSPRIRPGRVCPAAHCFSAAAIAGAAWYVFQPWGLALAVLAVVIAVCRVVTGVHYVSDVLAGLAFGTVFSVLGWNAFVLAASALGFYAIMLL